MTILLFPHYISRHERKCASFFLDKERVKKATSEREETRGIEREQNIIPAKM